MALLRKLEVIQFFDETGRALVIALNKWDGMDEYARDQIKQGVYDTADDAGISADLRLDIERALAPLRGKLGKRRFSELKATLKELTGVE